MALHLGSIRPCWDGARSACFLAERLKSPSWCYGDCMQGVCSIGVRWAPTPRVATQELPGSGPLCLQCGGSATATATHRPQDAGTCPVLAALLASTDRLIPLLAMGCPSAAAAAAAAVPGTNPATDRGNGSSTAEVSRAGEGGASSGGGATAVPAPVAGGGGSAAPYLAVQLVAALCRVAPRWLAGERRLLAVLRARWCRCAERCGGELCVGRASGGLFGLGCAFAICQPG
jgi:hypothetical protein